MNKIARALFAFASLAVATALPAAAHEYWMWAEPFSPAPGSVAVLSLNVGENFDGEPTPFVIERIAGLRLFSKGGARDLQAHIPRNTALQTLPVQIPEPGTHMLAFDTQPTVISLSADKFHAYLHDEGLDTVIKRREAAGSAATPGRERYRRHVKTLLRAGGSSDATYGVRSGQKLEIVPLADPLARSAGETLEFQLYFDQKPLAGALVKAWNKRGGQLLVIKARTGADGKAGFTLPWTGPWMISVVHMTAANAASGADWDSYWGNLTFELGP
ncbi:MAG: hypothetical protein JWQ23_2934 [Herminiimonas sp.]|nr:hypothetical protein [Herminiimonas sp.]